MPSHVLPIGRVVRLKDSTAAVMVAGYMPIAPSRPGYVWDYSGFKYPIGYVDDNEVYCFDNDQIEDLYALGYQDKEQLAFAQSLNDAAEEIKANMMDDNMEYPDDEPEGEE